MFQKRLFLYLFLFLLFTSLRGIFRVFTGWNAHVTEKFLALWYLTRTKFLNFLYLLFSMPHTAQCFFGAMFLRSARVMCAPRDVARRRRARNARENVPSHVTRLVIFETQKRTALKVHDPYFCEGLGRHVSRDTNRFLCNKTEGGEERE